MSIEKATKNYEEWLEKHLTILHEDLKLKHQRMAESSFPFLRATFYRWAQVWPEVCSELAKAPEVLAVGDLHVENFGTWRDNEGRLAWGVNDFDEAHPLPYTNDLVRLAASALLAIDESGLKVGHKDACEAILSGYSEGLGTGGHPFVLAEEHGALRQMALSELRDPVHFWAKMDSLSTVSHGIPESARKALEDALPERSLKYRIAHRIAGLGSLGRQRYVALADWHGGKVAREAKAFVPSACTWALEGREQSFFQEIITQAARCPDPFVRLQDGWIMRRLAPDCSRIELAALPKERDELRLLAAMGFEVANVHVGSKNAVAAVRQDLKKRPADWLADAAKDMTKAVLKDWEDWKAGRD